MRRAQLAAGAAVLLAAAPGAWLALSPCVYRGVKSNGQPDVVPLGLVASTPTGPFAEPFCAGSLVEMNGPGVITLLAVPILLAALGFIAVQHRRKKLTWAAALLLLGFCLAGTVSIGLLYYPSFATLLSAAVFQRHAAGVVTQGHG